MSDPLPKNRTSQMRRVERRRASERPILFGTSGWRGVLGEEVSFSRLRVLVRSIADWIHEGRRGEEVLVGWDNRLASRSMAETCAAILAESGLRPLSSTAATPTPCLTHALAQGSYAAGLMLTASHNPALDHGLKVFTRGGGGITDVHARRIEALARARMQEDGPSLVEAPSTPHDFLAGYRAALAGFLDHEAFARSPLTVVYDAMHGSGGGILDDLLEAAGARVERLRTHSDPGFGNGAPDPIPERLGELSRRTAAAPGLALGLATDGDGDRFGAVDGSGRMLSETQVVALLVDHLASAHRIRRGVAITSGIGSLVEKVAAAHGLRVERHPVGFKHLSAALEAGRVDAAGEETGGFAFAEMGLDKDGLLVGCLLAQLVASSGEGLERHVERLETRFGRSACGRTAIPSSPPLERGLARLQASPPQVIDGLRVARLDGVGELRFVFEDGGFLSFRRSGTEAMMRIGAEAESRAGLEARLESGRKLLEGAAQRLPT